MNALEDIIRQAIEGGKFDNLEGEGKPLSLEENPLEDPEWRLANKILADSGFAPGWIQKRREIEEDLIKTLAELQQSWELTKPKAGEEKDNLLYQADWERSLNRFHEQVEQLNKRINAYNLETPSPLFQRKLIDPAVEIERITSG